MQLHNTILYDIIKNICNQTEADGTVILNQKLPTSGSTPQSSGTWWQLRGPPRGHGWVPRGDPGTAVPGPVPSSAHVHQADPCSAGCERLSRIDCVFRHFQTQVIFIWETGSEICYCWPQ